MIFPFLRVGTKSIADYINIPAAAGEKKMDVYGVYFAAAGECLSGFSVSAVS